MDVVTRSHAIQQGLSKYFTGEPCKNGHIAQRYVQSCTCEMCIKASVIATPDPQRSEMAKERLNIARERLELSKERARLREEEQKQRSERMQIRAEELKIKAARVAAHSIRSEVLDSKAQFMKIRAVCPPEDLPVMKEFVHGLALIRIPSIKMADVCPLSLSRDGFFTFLCSPEDRKLIHDYGWHLQNARYPPLNMVAERERITAELQAEADASTEWPEDTPGGISK